MLLSLRTVTLLKLRPFKVTEFTPVKFAPLISTRVPPLRGPSWTLTLTASGGPRVGVGLGLGLMLALKLGLR